MQGVISTFRPQVLITIHFAYLKTNETLHSELTEEDFDTESTKPVNSIND